jgi:hypothetical protein
MEATVYRRHQKDCTSQDRYAPRCGCPLWFQFNWRGESGQFDGKKLKQGQNKWSSELTSMSKAHVADMVGTSPKEIRKTYAHWIKEREDRLDQVQRQAWIKQGLDENGNSREAIQ